MSGVNVAVVGVGAVGEEIIRVLRQRNFPLGKLKVLARSAREIVVDGETYNVEECTPDAFEGVDIALFAGTEGEKGAAVTFAQEAIRRGAVVIDNGQDFRMDPNVPLVVPECNAEDVEKHKGIIANPNCSTIQMVAALKPLHDAARIKRIIVTSYQSVSGGGRSAIRELENQVRRWAESGECGEPEVQPVQIAFNVIPQIGGIGPDGFSSEERKLIVETHKILHDDTIAVTPTTVRVPVLVGHSEAITIETERKLTAQEAEEILSRAPGIRVIDEVGGENRAYPTCLDAAGRDETYVGRIREDLFVPNALSLWVVADNLRKGAATNAVQIAEELVNRGLVGQHRKELIHA
ncbi:MAG: aspartate-semialdehyde dehydrogenase [Armatimonadetes bacterium]|nr:aspartate-semialdehyde dehydrogenase [Armatimonadota bacterium]